MLSVSVLVGVHRGSQKSKYQSYNTALEGYLGTHRACPKMSGMYSVTFVKNTNVLQDV